MIDLEYLCTKKQKFLTLQLILGLKTSYFTCCEQNMYIYINSMGIIWVLSNCPLQIITLWISWVPSPSEFQSTWQVLV